MISGTTQAIALRQDDMLNMFISGATMSTVVQKYRTYGVGYDTIYEDMKVALKRLTEFYSPENKEIHAANLLATYDHLIRLNIDTPYHHDTVIKAQQAKAKLLKLDDPTVQVNIQNNLQLPPLSLDDLNKLINNTDLELEE